MPSRARRRRGTGGGRGGVPAAARPSWLVSRPAESARGSGSRGTWTWWLPADLAERGRRHRSGGIGQAASGQGGIAAGAARAARPFGWWAGWLGLGGHAAHEREGGPALLAVVGDLAGGPPGHHGHQ